MLHHVSSDGYLKGMQCLVAAGANIHARNAEGRTALHTAARYLFVDGIDYLLAVCFVDPNIADTHLQTPLHDVLQSILENPEESKNGLSAILSLLRASADWTLENRKRQSPFEMAKSETGIRPEITEALESVDWSRNEPATIWLKRDLRDVGLKPSTRDFVVQLPRFIDNVPSFETFRIGILRTKAASFYQVSAFSIQLLHEGHGLGDDSRSCT